MHADGLLGGLEVLCLCNHKFDSDHLARHISQPKRAVRCYGVRQNGNLVWVILQYDKLARVEYITT